jgi:ferredoxin--NADP+ reductase
VAIVGAGPAGVYAARELLFRSTAEITLYDKLPQVGGLARYGVAPDHPATRQIVGVLERVVRHPRIRLRLGVEFGRDIDHASLAAEYDAVIYAVGAPESRLAGIPGERAAGSCTAGDFVAWYNSHPRIDGCPVVLSGPRAVVIGNGNVAIDIARLLLSDPTRLASADLTDPVRRTLTGSGIREVVLLGRRGPEAAAYSEPALRELLDLAPLEDADLTVAPQPGRRLVLRFATSPTSWNDGVLETTSGPIQAGTLISAIGFQSPPIPGLPYDDDRSLVPHLDGRVVGLDRTYVTGWTRRGSTGGLGHNRLCAEQTVTALLADALDARTSDLSRSTAQS